MILSQSTTDSTELVLATDRLLLRPWKDEDLPAFAALNADSRVMAFLPARLDRAASDRLATRIRSKMDAHGFGFWAVEVKGVAPFIGFVGLSVPSFQAHFTPCVEIGWRLATPYWGRGYATEAGRRALDCGLSTLSLPEIVAFTALNNHRSQAVMKRLGMHSDRAEDFEHPKVPERHPLRRHVLYRIGRGANRQLP